MASPPPHDASPRAARRAKPASSHWLNRASPLLREGLSFRAGEDLLEADRTHARFRNSRRGSQAMRGASVPHAQSSAGASAMSSAVFSALFAGYSGRFRMFRALSDVLGSYAALEP